VNQSSLIKIATRSKRAIGEKVEGGGVVEIDGVLSKAAEKRTMRNPSRGGESSEGKNSKIKSLATSGEDKGGKWAHRVYLVPNKRLRGAERLRESRVCWKKGVVACGFI